MYELKPSDYCEDCLIPSIARAARQAICIALEQNVINPETARERHANLDLRLIGIAASASELKCVLGETEKLDEGKVCKMPFGFTEGWAFGSNEIMLQSVSVALAEKKADGIGFSG